ncbi:MAG: fibronectin type III-like domain-contianing protein, partial [Bacteroidales bacterium]|nr:fibronectin type III-like domain-contianing protein [Bacteroidales bacterium]
FTYPRYVNSIHTYDFKVSEMSATMGGEYNYDAVMDVQWPFGTGLSYTTFAYSDLQVDKEVFSAEDTLRFMVQVTNTGTKAGAEAVLLFSSDEVASVIPDIKRLRAFRKVSLQPGASETVSLAVPARDLAFVGEDGAWHLEEGTFSISVGGLRRRVRCSRTSTWK